MHRFYVPTHQIAGDHAFLVGEQCRQIRTVLRMRQGDRIALFDGSGREYVAEIRSTSSQRVDLFILEVLHPQTEPEIHLTVVLSLLKGGNTELILQKCTELGAARFVLMSAKRTVPRLEESKLGLRLERWSAVVREAAEQSGRVKVPELHGVLPFEEAINRVIKEGKLFVAWEQERSRMLGDILRENRIARPIYVVGPEGGFTPEEVAYAREAGAETVSLGPRILRSETAAIVGTAVFVMSDDLRWKGAWKKL